jgi:UDPglucose--hexose-1-phosphate uridylyltransferase
MNLKMLTFMIEYAISKLGLLPDEVPFVVEKMKQTIQIEQQDEDNNQVLTIHDVIGELNQQFSHLEGIERERAIDLIFSLLSPSQVQVNETFWRNYKKSPREATKYLFELGKDNYYIQTDKIKKNRMYELPNLIVTINLSKEEKDNKQIALARLQPQQSFPKCMLCYENVGYLGKGNQAPRGTLRVAEMELCGQSWFMQYSPYPYFDEHAIFIDKIHRPMSIDKQSISQLFEIVNMFPHYFVGSNAAMPIIGGSILSHAHFQGGKWMAFPMMNAKIAETVQSNKYPDLMIGIIDWKSFVIRVTGTDQNHMIQLTEDVMKHWESYTDASVGIYHETHGEPHHGITPILYHDGKKYVLHIVLRSNLTSEEHPGGIFHAHQEYHHIKKEGIGLIEAMGMFILPGRLAEVMDYFIQIQEVDDLILMMEKFPIHREWISSTFSHLTFPQSKEYLKTMFIHELSKVCQSILENISMFKADRKGIDARNRYIKAIF